MLYADTLLDHPEWMIPLTVHTDDSDKQLGDVISSNSKPIGFSQGD